MKKALISVFDKTGIVSFAQELLGLGYELISTGGTYKLLEENQVPVTYISEITGFPEILDGRVKTLHPKIHGGILAKETSTHLSELESLGGSLIEMVVVNLYPFEKVSQDPKATFDDILENIDIGGPTLLRAAAKNHPRVTVICDPKDYQTIVAELKTNQGTLDQSRRKQLAGRAFAHTAYYDTLIADFLRASPYPEKLTIALEKVDDLRYGENPHQSAAIYREMPRRKGLCDAIQLHGKQLSFNNYYDSQAAWQLVSTFEQPCAVAVKHSNPCGLGVGSNLYEAYSKAYAGDPVSIFGGIVACNREIDKQTAKAMADIFLEVIIAPDFCEDALHILTRKANIRLLKLAPKISADYDWKRIAGGFIVQEPDLIDLDKTRLQVVTKRKPTEGELQDLLFGWKVVKFVKSNAIVVCKEQQLLGVGAGQMNRVQSVGLSTKQAGDKAKGAALASDAFFPFADNIELAAKAGITSIIQPGGSIRDEEVIKACDSHNITMVFTGIRHFRH